MGEAASGSDDHLKADESKGSVVLRRANAPLILCDLKDITETGCRCVAQVRRNEWSDPEKSPAFFRSGEVYQAEMVSDPHIPLLCLSVEIRSSLALSATAFELDCGFVNVEPDLKEILIEALEKIASEKDGPPHKRLSAFKKPQEFATPAADGQTEWTAPKLGEILCRTNAIAPGRIASAVSSARQTGLKLGEYLIREGVVTPLQILEARSAQTGLAYTEFDVDSIPEDLINRFPLEHLKQLNCLPIAMDGELIRIACANPLLKPDLDALEMACGKRVELVLCPEDLPAKFFEAFENARILKRRTHQRFRVSMPASIRCGMAEDPKKFGAPVPGQVIEISKGGMQVIGPESLRPPPDTPPSERLKWIVMVGSAPKEIYALCDVRHIRHAPNDSGGSDCVYGLKIDSILDANSDLIR